MPNKDFLEGAKPVQSGGDFLQGATSAQETPPGVPPSPEPEGIRGGNRLLDQEHHAMPHSLSDIGSEGVTALSNIGSGGLGLLSTIGRASPIGAADDLLHKRPTIYQDAYHAAQHPMNTFMGMGNAAVQHPLETGEQLLGATAVGGGAGLLAEPETAAGLSSLNRKINPLPLRSRAVAKFNSIAGDVGNAPVQMNKTAPAIENFHDYERTGGQGNPVVNKLVRETTPDKPPLTFPEGRNFYTNISRETARPPFLRRMMEEPSAPDMRRNLGPVREGLNSDLTDTVQRETGRGEDYTSAGKEYANNAKLRRMGLIGARAAGGVAAEEVARRSGLLGKVGRRLIP